MKNNLSEICKPIQPQLREVDRIIQESIQSRAELIPQISNHLIQGGGKRIRPTLLIASARACGYRGKRILPMGAAVELLHSATLLHDDVVDCSQHRRGRPAAHTVFCNSASILVGDYILAKGISLVVEEKDIEIVKPLAWVIVRLAEGEALQLARRGSIPQESEYLTIITSKTALLFAATCQVGALVARAPKPYVRALQNFGTNFGIAFQLIDDCLDYLPGPGGVGKDWGRDLNEGKVTLPLLQALRRCHTKEKEQVLRLIRVRAEENASPLPAQTILRIRGLIEKYQGFEYTRDRAQVYTDLAKRALQKIRPASRRKLLEDLADAYQAREN
ncbi:MAG: polyprenyl synthetase family protein [Proteobacteria bacterium]|nr:polyprenyl synthetase family protein [Pseudomonadota bacterium]